MESKFYVPILKSKSGEFMALSKLNSRAKKSIAPLFEVTPLEWDHSEQKKPKTLDDHLTSFCKKFITKWGSEGEGDGLFSKPESIDVARFGHVYVADTSNNNVQLFVPNN